MFNPAWSPDSKWLAYTRQLRNHLHAVFAYQTEEAKPHQVTDGMSDAAFARFDKEGKYLYLMASTDAALSTGWFDMSSLAHPVTRNVYAVVLKKGVPSPIAPESDEEKADKDKEKDKDKDKDKDAKPPAVQIDFQNIGQRIVALSIPARNYVDLEPGKTGVLFLVEGPPVDPMGGDDSASLTLPKFELKTRKTEKILEGVNSFNLAFNGEKMLYKQKDQWV
ncbi:MAG: protease, partial [Acidobacteria bacterium]